MDKDAIREATWSRLEERGHARFPFPPHGRIPNFAGAETAAERLTTLEWWPEASVIKANPDAPQRPVRERALLAGTTVLMAVPRLAEAQPFIALDPASIDEPAEAATIKGANRYGEKLALADVPPVDAIVAGSVAVDRDGRRIGKGEGYSDLEFAILLETDRIPPDVPIATTVHDDQVSEQPLPIDPHDVPVDYVVTPTTMLRAIDRPDRPDGLERDALSAERRGAMPVLEEILGTAGRSGSTS